MILGGYFYMRKTRFKLKLGQKINLIILAIILFLSVVIGIVVVQQVTAGIKEFATEKARGDLHLSMHYFDAQFPGDWEVKGDLLYKGNVKMNENFDIVDEIGEYTGDTVTIFLGNTRIATNVLKADGTRAVGTTVSDEVAHVVLTEQKEYFGEANVAGHTYVSAYTPLFNKAGEVIGIYYVGAPQHIIDQTITSFMKIFIVVLIIAIILSVLLSIWYTRRLKKRLNALSTALDNAKNGDFTTEIIDLAGDELSDVSASYNEMRINLQSMIQQVADTSNQVASSSQELIAGAEQTSKATEQITYAIQEVANGAEHQAKNIEETTRAFEEVTIGIGQLAENAAIISDSADQTSGQAKLGGEFVEKTAQQMDTIHSSVNKSSEAIQLLGESSNQIGEITRTITDIANQTNLLALNAAIEAARAGEHGKGFAVVADEVQKLAEQSQQSSKKISELIQTIQNDMGQTQHFMDQVKSDVQAGLGIVAKTEESFVEITNATEKMREQINEMAATAEQMSASAEEVSATVTGIMSITKQTSEHTQSVSASTEEQHASMEEVVASASTLSQMAEQLQEEISKFKI